MKRLIVFEREIEKLLLDVPATRDDDLLLYHHLLRVCGVPPEITSVSTLLDGIRAEQYPPFDSVSRLRRKLQDKHESLRGDLYYERKGIQREVQLELGYNA